MEKTPIKAALTVLAIVFTIVLTTIYTTRIVHAGDTYQLQVLRMKGCASCHGTRGQGNPIMKGPKLAGQNQLELEAKLKAYRNGEHSNTTMTVMTYNLTDREIKALATYFSRF